jgi:hypothetical protein
VLGAIFLGVMIVAILQPALRGDPVRFAALIAVAAIAAAAQIASGIATLVHRRALNAERPDSD